MDASARWGRHSEALRNYNLGRKLGSGTFAKVNIAEHKLTGHKVAVKIINCQKMREMEMEEKTKREIKILKQLFIHPHIIRLYEVIYTPTDIYIVMEFCEHGSLYDYMAGRGRLQEAEANRVFQQIISGVEYCHKSMVAHRDLKPENLLLDSKYNVKLADFGLSNIMHDGHFLQTSCGSPNYAAPEVISVEHYAGPEVDVWSCGVILYALLCGSLPFDEENKYYLIQKIKGGIYTFPRHLPTLAQDLIRRMLDVDPMKRITIPEIREHQWFQMHLPRYLAPETSHQVKMVKFLKIDEDTIRDVVNMGFNRDHVCESLYNRLQNDATVAYYLLLDNRLHVASDNLGADDQESMERDLNQLDSMESASYSTRHYFPGSTDFHSNGLRPHYTVERKWDLGLQSCAHPREIMVEVLKALHELNACWKKNGYYNVKCRWCVGAPRVHNMVDVNNSFLGDSMIVDNNDANRRLPTVIKFEMQLYKTRDNKYVLDMQRVNGPQLLFLHFCSVFFTKLRVL